MAFRTSARSELSVAASTAVVVRLFGLVGMAAPAAGTHLARALARAPRDRLVRIVAWCAWECRGGPVPEKELIEGMRVLTRGWGDRYPTTGLPSGAVIVKVEAPGQPDAALVTRRGRAGRGWLKENLSTLGEVRPEVALGARWLEAVAGCVVHDDCAANPELGIACASASAR